MRKRIETLGDRLLSLVVPRAEAAAAPCWEQNDCGYYCLSRLCCDTPFGLQCGPCRWTC
jgi:hypothetical protein